MAVTFDDLSSATGLKELDDYFCPEVTSSSAKDRLVGLIFDERMCKHYSPDGRDHPECPDRVRVIWERLHCSGLAQRCIILSAKDVEDNHLSLVHAKNHIDLIKKISRTPEPTRKNIASRFNLTYFNEGSTVAASLAAGSVIEAIERVASGELDSAFAIVRPPGHHAKEDEPMGFCLYNNVAIGASFLLNERREFGINKILIVDWDVHHGNGTQKMFYNDSRVLFFSVHRHDYGTFYPTGHDGSYIMTGEGPGAGHNINVPWEHGNCGDADYLAVWDHILVPVAKEFDPDLIVISAGFDAAIGDPLGGCLISPNGYSIMLDKLMVFAKGKIVMALEGGHNPNSIASSAQACVEVLLNGKSPKVISEAYPFASTWRVIREVRQELSKYWPVLAVELPEKMICKTAQIEVRQELSKYWPVLAVELPEKMICKTAQIEILSSDTESEDNIQPVSNLKVNSDSEETTNRPSWRSEHSNVDIWYATYGSNMSTPKFCCYIEGGQIEGMKRSCVGSMDKSKPKKIIWKTLPRRLFFAGDCTATWGRGGVAFLHPNSNVQEKTYTCLYKITLEQFNDVLHQENISNHDMSNPLFDLAALQTIQTENSLSVELLQSGWYHNVVYLGNEEDIPILTMTCSLSDIDSSISRRLRINPPCKEYADTLIKGLVEGKQLSEVEARAYIEEAYTKPLRIEECAGTSDITVTQHSIEIVEDQIIEERVAEDGDIDQWLFKSSGYTLLQGTELCNYVNLIAKELPDVKKTIPVIDDVFDSDFGEEDMKTFLKFVNVLLKLVQPVTRDTVTSHIYTRIHMREAEAQMKADQAIAIWRGFTKCRFNWCPLHKRSSFTVHLLTFISTILFFLRTRAAKFIWGPQISSFEFQIRFMTVALLILAMAWGVIVCLSVVYKRVGRRSRKFKKIAHKFIWGVYRILIPTLSICVTIDGLDDRSAFFMLVSGSLSVASGVGFFFVTDDFGFTPAVMVVALTTVSNMTSSNITRFAAMVVVGLCEEFIGPVIRRFNNFWFGRKHIWIIRAIIPGFGRWMTEKEEAEDYARRRDLAFKFKAN